MLLFVVKSDQTGTIRKSRLIIPDCATTTDFLKKICNYCQVQQQYLIAKLKQQPTNLRIIEGWPIEKYPFHLNSQIMVQTIKERRNHNYEQDALKQQKKIDEQLEDQKECGSPTRVSENQSSFQCQDNIDLMKYLEDQLQFFLNAIRNKLIQKASNILKSQPECNNEKLLNRIMQKKLIYLLNGNGACGWTALHEAIHADDAKMVQFLLSKPPTDPNVVSEDSHTPLQLSVVLQRQNIFQLLMNHPKIDINKVTKKGTVLHFAIANQKWKYAQLLIDAGANPEIQNSQEITVTQMYSKLNNNILKFKTVKKQTIYQMKGTVYKVSKLSSKLKQRKLVVNPFKNQFSIYEGKDNEKISQKITINSINSVEVKQDLHWPMKKQYFYFTIRSSKLKLTIGVKHEQIRRAWIKGLQKCIRHCQSNNIKNNEKQQQFIQELNDVDNSIVVMKKNKQDQNVQDKIKNKKTFSIDFSFITQSQNEQFPKQQIKESKSNLIICETSPKHSQITQSQLPQIVFIPPNVNSEIDRMNGGDQQKQSQTIGKELIKEDTLITLEEKKKAVICFRDFQILRELGHGSFGKVFLARHVNQQKFYALKVLNKRKLLLKKQMKYAVSQATILKKVDCPFIIKLYYSFQTPANLYIAIDYCPNGDLSTLITQQQTLSQRVCRFYIAQLILAIEYLHKQKILYRDLKPQNILIGSDGYIKLIDFNLSKQNNFSTSFCGSSAYLYPEMLNKKGVGLEADIYGIGCVLYEMLVGVPPYFDEDIKILYENIKTGKLKFPPQISKSAKHLISSLLERNVNKRIGSKNMNQIKKHQFFSGFEWKNLQQLTMKPPMQIQSKFKDKFTQLQTIVQHGFGDSDYQNDINQTNRIKNFTFVREK